MTEEGRSFPFGFEHHLNPHWSANSWNDHFFLFPTLLGRAYMSLKLGLWSLASSGLFCVPSLSLADKWPWASYLMAQNLTLLINKCHPSHWVDIGINWINVYKDLAPTHMYVFPIHSGKWQPTPVFLPGKSMDWGAWCATVHGVAKSWTRPSNFTSLHFTYSEMVKYCLHYCLVLLLLFQEGMRITTH